MTIGFTNSFRLGMSSTLVIVSISNSYLSVSTLDKGSNTKDEDLPCLDFAILLKLVAFVSGTLYRVGVGLKKNLEILQYFKQ